MKLSFLLGILIAFSQSARCETIPLPEHPRPDFERTNWKNLNGAWDFGFAAGKFDRKIVVPFGWGSKLSGVKDEGDTGYYRRNIRVPSAWKGKRVFLVVGAADHDTTCTFDGYPLGKHVGGYTPFEFELTDYVRWEKDQTLEFKIWDPSAKVAHGGHYLYGKQGYGNARGIWQTVYLEARGMDYVESVRFYPSVTQGTLTCEIALASPAAKAGKALVQFAGKRLEVPFAHGEAQAAATVKLENPHLWTLEDPYLYDVRIDYEDDSVKTYFGFREIGTGRTPNGDRYVTLNGKPIYLQLCLDQSYHPDGWYTFPTDAFMKNEILLSKRLGLSGNRVHIKVEVPRKLYWADKLGVLIQADVPCAWGYASEAMFEEHWKCFEEMVKRDFNHPSIYQWTLFNETWGLFSNHPPKSEQVSRKAKENRVYEAWTQRAVAAAYFKAKRLDPTRLVEDNSPCKYDHVVTDVNTWHRYLPGYRWGTVMRETCEKCKIGSPWNYVKGKTQGDEVMMNSECGNVWGYLESAGDSDFTWDYHLMMNAFRRHLKCAGWLYTEHHDVCNEWNGYVRFDRSPKYDGLDELAGMTLADFHRDAAITFYGREGYETGEMLATGQQVVIPVGVSFTTDKYAGKSLQLQISDWYFDARGEKRQVEAKRSLPTAVGKSWQCEKLWDVSFTAPSEPSSGCRVFELLADGQPIAKNFWSFGVTNGAPSTLVASQAEWSGGTTNVLGGLKLNGFGKGFFEFELAAPEEGGVFRAELSAKRKNGKDYGKYRNVDMSCMLGGGTHDRSKSPNSYPQTSDEKFPSRVSVYVDGKCVKTVTLPDDPADHRGLLSWLSQPHDERLREAGSYGWLVEAEVPAAAVKGGKVTVRLEADNGLAVYGPAFGRYPLGPNVNARR